MADRGYARNAREEQILISAGLSPRLIYREGRGAETLCGIKMRPGETLATVGGLRALGDTRQEIVAQVRRIHDMGAAVVDIETGCRSDKRGAEMLDRALAKIKGEASMKPGQATEMAAKSARARTKGRTPKREAQIKWLKSPELTNGEVVAQLRGWSQRALYDAFGKRGVTPGRRPKT